MTDELDAPLTGKKSKKGALRARLGKLPSLPKIKMEKLSIAGIASALVVIIISFASYQIATIDTPMGGRPVTTVEILSGNTANPIATEVAAPAAVLEEPNVSSPGVTNPNGPNGISITNVDEALAANGANARESVGNTQTFAAIGLDKELMEETQNGPIPHVGPNGKTPFGTYSRATDIADGGNKRIAIVVTGLGLSETTTLAAIETLPNEVTLAFAPYGRTLNRTTAAARAEGHELLLQVPLEPFDYPENDPGPQTLLAGQTPRSNLDKLYWIMARFGGYYGVMNHMGARFTSEPVDFGPVMEEIGTRGLAYFDDGSSKRSVAPQLAARNEVAFARGSIDLDRTPSPKAILAALAELETLAVENGSAVGVASALPVSVTTISEWAAGLKDKGFTLVPVSSVMSTK